MNLTIRQETPEDYRVVKNLIRLAFANEEYSNQSEHHLVSQLRKSITFVPELSLVAVLDGEIIGHILLTKVTIRNRDQDFESLALAPVSILPEFQNRGIGGKLIEAAHQKARELDFDSVVLLGHQDYYPRFGYKPAHSFGITFPFEVPPENCMAIELIPAALDGVSGEVVYPDEFFQN